MGCVFQVGELVTVNSSHSLGRHDIHSWLSAADRDQTRPHWLGLSGEHCHRADGELTRATLAARTQHAGGASTQQTILRELRLQTHPRHVQLHLTFILPLSCTLHWTFPPNEFPTCTLILHVTLLLHCLSCWQQQQQSVSYCSDVHVIVVCLVLQGSGIEKGWRGGTVDPCPGPVVGAWEQAAFLDNKCDENPVQ